MNNIEYGKKKLNPYYDNSVYIDHQFITTKL